jgi:hypothetical protein
MRLFLVFLEDHDLGGIHAHDIEVGRAISTGENFTGEDVFRELNRGATFGTWEAHAPPSE